MEATQLSYPLQKPMWLHLLIGIVCVWFGLMDGSGSVLFRVFCLMGGMVQFLDVVVRWIRVPHPRVAQWLSGIGWGVWVLVVICGVLVVLQKYNML